MHSILLQLKNELTPFEFDNYISQLSYNEKYSRDDRIVLNAPNIFVASWIKTKYANKIAHLFEAHNGFKPEVIIEVLNPNKKKENKPNIRKQNTASNLNPSFTFASFVVGNSNTFAFNVAKAVAQNQSTSYNPLVIYGNTGLGKTHLLNAIGNANVSVGKNVIYTTSEQFLNDFLFHIRNNTMERFREKYRACDYLLIDDIQFLSGKDQIQEEFFHTFNELKENNKQIVLTSDRPPKDMNGLEERLKTRFTSGLLADIQPPELETKINIIRAKCELDGIHLNDAIINFIAANINDNIREIEGVLVKLNFSMNVTNIQEISLEFIKDILKEYIKESKENVDMDSIIETVSRYYNLKPSDIKSKSRSKNIVTARKIVIYLARTLTPNSMPYLANFFGMKDHSTVSKAMKSIQNEINENQNFKTIIEEIKNKIK
ncbi:chromosomal replication initiator protein DnaA [Helicobacter turcicus]|uniref:Chromosomal replication initiator protein DnaA n=1 Tax=Helicobacter turcicus TaxID=2867412 RepID=A0ABS7JPX0_9HELI|nr:chromosomal replication initiator protein DnaA [Helicobacter turcicus]MBX7491456.1 chromosomal replication initiator protein DnaA [Helicobacter turcicus]MBX7545915.1 chromosomal replication initiator protein DnaA [Helicobacter turcicus]